MNRFLIFKNGYQMKNKIDLHLHSKYSDDGELEPLELVKQCFEKSVKIMSITDHNCVKANAPAELAAQKVGIQYIPGIEIDCTFEEINFHILGYGINYKSTDFQKIEDNIESQNFSSSLERLELTQVLGFHVTEAEMWAISKNTCNPDIWSGEMFAEVLLKKLEYKNHPLLQPYHSGGSRSDNPLVNFYWDFYSQGKPCYVKIAYPSMKQIISIIHANHGIAVLAHPGVNLRGHFDLIDEIIDLGLDGIEAFSSYHTPPETEFFYQKAIEKQLCVTCGSDYHGKVKPAVKIGCHGCFLSECELMTQLVLK